MLISASKNEISTLRTIDVNGREAKSLPTNASYHSLGRPRLELSRLPRSAGHIIQTIEARRRLLGTTECLHVFATRTLLNTSLECRFSALWTHRSSPRTRRNACCVLRTVVDRRDVEEGKFEKEIRGELLSFVPWLTSSRGRLLLHVLGTRRGDGVDVGCPGRGGGTQFAAIWITLVSSTFPVKMTIASIAMRSTDLSKNKTARILADAEKGGYGVIAAIA